ncbi:MAG: translocation/assembly module TamB domain-containing protein [Dysgonamonadaceae bacterium]|jgi:hypothetical protein|nr:translocation/assembly module TamB domain-containing protein [Dysgonamonadaceae bacterium]
MRTLRIVFRIILILLLVFYVLPVVVFQVPYFQKKISEKASKELREKLGVDVKIGHVNFELFNKIILKDLYLEDQNGDTLFQAGRLGAGFEFLPLLKGRLRFETVQLFSFQFNLNRENADSPLNLQFVLDAFADRDTTKKDLRIDLQIKKLNIRRGHFSYRVKDKPETPDKFNSSDVKIKDLSAKIKIHTFTKDQLIADFQNLAFSEKSGFEVQRLSFDIQANNDSIKAGNLKIKLPNSILALEEIVAGFKEAERPENDLSNALFKLRIEPSTIQMKDFKAFLPIFSNFKDVMTIEGSLSGNANHLELMGLSIRDKKNLQLNANIELENSTDPNHIFVKGEIEDLYFSSESIEKMAHNFSKDPVSLPQQIFRLGNIYFKGNVSGFFHHLSAHGIFKTDIGAVNTDVNIGRDEHFFINGNIASQKLDINRLMNSTDYGIAGFNIKINATQGVSKKFSGNINALVEKFEYKGYSYENMSIVGAFTPQSFSGKFNLDSREGKIDAEGLFVLKGEKSEFNFYAGVEHMLLDKLNLSKKYKNSDLSFKVKANFTGDNPDNLIGDVFLSDVKFSTDKGGYYLDTFNIIANRMENEKLLILKSDLINGEIRGLYSFPSIIPSISRLLSGYLPSFFHFTKPQKTENPNNFSINLTIEDTQEFSLILDLPFVLFNKTRLVGQYNSVYDKFRLELYSPRMNYRNMMIESGAILAENPENTIKVNVSGVGLQKNDRKLPFSLSLNAANDDLDAAFKWDSNMENMYLGNLAFRTHFSRESENSPLKTNIDLYETSAIFNNAAWKIHPATIEIDSGKIDIQHLKIDHDDQFVRINGVISSQPEDNLKIDLNKVDLEYVFTTLDIPALEFGGLASGNVNVRDLLKTRKLSTTLDVKDFSFNSTPFGDLQLSGAWDEEAQGILMKGDLYKNDSTKVGVDGIIYPVKEELSIVFDALNANASFLRKYTKNIASNVSGRLTGKLRLFGNLNKPTVEGDVYVKNGGFGIDFLNTYYTFTDTVRCQPDLITVKDIYFVDKNGERALANGYVRHNLFDDFQYSAELKFDNFLVFNATESQNPNIYGTIFASGIAGLWGTEDIVNINVRMKNDRNTKLSLNFMEERDASNYDFIQFIDSKPDTTSLVEKYFELVTDKPIYMKSLSGTDVRFNMTLDANPDATVEIIMDPVTGDRIRTNGTANNLQVEYGTRTPLKMKGKYTIEQGKYNFSFQQMFFRDFNIKEGSSVSFPGDPYAAVFDVNAVYSIVANLGDLNPELIQYAGRSSVMTNCVLSITGPMAHSNIKFNLEVPESEYIDRQIKNYINTEDMMNRQIVYLLILNRFFTPAERGNPNSSRTNNDLSALASTTLSSSLSSIVSSFTDNVQVGTRIRTEDSETMTGTEVELILSSQLLNNRLILNGNLGYRNQSHMNEGLTPIVGDFDLEYKLTPGGGVRLKAYNHYNYRYYYMDSRSKTTQGIGIIFRKDFERVNELLGKKRIDIPILADSIK